jgi:hypothetical protein
MKLWDVQVRQVRSSISSFTHTEYALIDSECRFTEAVPNRSLVHRSVGFTRSCTQQEGCHLLWLNICYFPGRAPGPGFAGSSRTSHYLCGVTRRTRRGLWLAHLCPEKSRDGRSECKRDCRAYAACTVVENDRGKGQGLCALRIVRGVWFASTAARLFDVTRGHF